MMGADNQHATLRYSWLAGFLDGDGSFMIIRSRHKDAYRYFYRISLANTNKEIIDEVARLLEMLEIKYCLYSQDRRGIKKKFRQTYLIHITNKDGIIKLCRAVNRHLIGKKDQAERLLEAVIHWDTVDKKELYFQFKALNRRVPRKS